jgi:putative RecB family exonuclease
MGVEGEMPARRLERPRPENVFTHLSYSKIECFDACRKKYRFRYGGGAQPESGEALRFGSAIHSVAEDLIREHVRKGAVSPLDHDRAAELYRGAWARYRLSGAALHAEGSRMIEDFISHEGFLDPGTVVGVELSFQIRAGMYDVVGKIDRVDRTDEGLVVIDYKTNRAPFTVDEVESSLQLSLYSAAVRELMKVDDITLEYRMLRLGLSQRTTRTVEQEAAAIEYVRTVGDAIACEQDWPATVTPLCGWCDYRSKCDAYSDAIYSDTDAVLVDHDKIDEVMARREAVAARLRILGQEKDSLDGVLKARAKQDGPFVADGREVRMVPVRSLSYDLGMTVRLISDATGWGSDEVIARVTEIDRDKLQSVLRTVRERSGLTASTMLKAEIEESASIRTTARLDVSRGKK